jgi:hypothetical protein
MWGSPTPIDTGVRSSAFAGPYSDDKAPGQPRVVQFSVLQVAQVWAPRTAPARSSLLPGSRVHRRAVVGAPPGEPPARRWFSRCANHGPVGIDRNP